MFFPRQVLGCSRESSAGSGESSACSGESSVGSDTSSETDTELASSSIEADGADGDSTDSSMVAIVAPISTSSPSLARNLMTPDASARPS